MALNIIVYHIGLLMLILKCEPYLNREDEETLNDVIDFIKDSSSLEESISLLTLTYKGIVDTPQISQSTKLLSIRQLIRLKMAERKIVKNTN
ncbi:hypothetical protein [Photobacterium damselae]|uniref:hypothetical protein n=1 Tax=Photobacterium damselae TaxID=38293 RepID=UPI001EFED84A|nr:hypothetical protein [Photobacterium damselae]MCG9780721.1 hypothetical protein [Photobacterium damselae]